MLTDAKKKFIEFMMSCDVLRFGDFVTKSGRRTPYFVNTGLYRTGAQIARLGDFYAACVHEMAAGEVDALFGPAYKGIPLVTTTSASLSRLYGGGPALLLQPQGGEGPRRGRQPRRL